MFFLRFSLSCLLYLYLLGLGACAPDSLKDQPPLNNELSRMTLKERKDRAPNPAFEAVYQRDQTKVLELLETKPLLFSQKNSMGDTPLMTAMGLQEEDMVLRGVAELPIEALMATDEQGRGYLSLAAGRGFVSVMDKLAEKYKESLPYGLSRFHHMDFLDHQERHALFYAANGATAQSLKDYWMLWSLTALASWTWFSSFYQQKDLGGQNFLHQAAQDNRHDLLNWAMKDICGAPPFQESEYLFGLPGWIAKMTSRGASLIQRLPVIPDDLVNQADHVGNRPLHLAARQGHRESVQSLASCPYTLYDLKNQWGRNPLSEMLAHLDPNQVTIELNYKETFDILISKNNLISISANPVANRINAEDEEGHSALHHAARLKDKYFYNKMKPLGDVYQEDHRGKTPEGLNQANP